MFVLKKREPTVQLVISVLTKSWKNHIVGFRCLYRIRKYQPWSKSRIFVLKKNQSYSQFQILVLKKNRTNYTVVFRSLCWIRKCQPYSQFESVCAKEKRTDVLLVSHPCTKKKKNCFWTLNWRRIEPTVLFVSEVCIEEQRTNRTVSFRCL